MQRTGVNRPGYAWGENHSERSFEIVATDEDGHFEYHDPRGGTVIVSEPRPFIVFIDDGWEVMDHNHSQILWDFDALSFGTDRLPFIPTPDRRAMIYLKEPETLYEKQDAGITDSRVKRKTGRDPVHHQQSLPEEWPPSFPPAGYATDG